MSNNVFNYGSTVSNIQIQQGSINSSQVQKIISNESLDLDKVESFILKIKKYESHFDEEYGPKMAAEVRDRGNF